ncbi:MAG: hypothetical protein IPN17_38705 [Deltaproteobacteria bacterium]|nr:hypothetical protein [Deltaproteobacteria bacterium]
MAHDRNVGFENEFITVADLSRATLARHPWSLGGGGAGDLKELIEQRCTTKLDELVDAIGRSTHTGDDEAYFLPEAAASRLGFSEHESVPIVKGEQLRDWQLIEDEHCLFPYDKTTVQPIAPAGRAAQYYWLFRASLRNRRDFGERIEQRVVGGRRLTWFEHSMFFPERFRRPFSIGFAFVATHNHFVLDRGDKVFNRTAPAIKLSASATEDDHLALLGWLNTSTSCFWLKQVSHDKGSGTDTGKWQAEPAKIAFEFSGGSVEKIPLPVFNDSQRARFLSLARALDRLAGQRMRLLTELLPMHPARSLSGASELRDLLAIAASTDRSLLQQQITLQEEIDWTAYALLGLADDLTSSAVGLEIDALAGTRWARVHSRCSSRSRARPSASTDRRWRHHPEPGEQHNATSGSGARERSNRRRCSRSSKCPTTSAVGW